MKTALFRSFFAASLLLPASRILASDAEEMAQPSGGPPPGAVAAGGFSGKTGSIGIADGMIKIGAPAGGLLLLNPRFSMWDDDEKIAGVGLIYRNIFPAVGRSTLHGRGEYRETATGEDLSTFSAGFEQRAPWYTLRLRGYISPHGARLTDQRTVETTERLPGGAMSTISQTFEEYEIPLSGWESEIGVRFPIPRVLGQARGFVGWYFLDGPRIDPQEGWMTRFEYRPRERFAFEMVTFFDNEFDNSEIFWGGRIIIPFGPGSSSDDNAIWFEPLPYSPRSVIRRIPLTENMDKRVETVTPPPRRDPPPEVLPPVVEEETEGEGGGGGDEDNNLDLDLG